MVKKTYIGMILEVGYLVASKASKYQSLISTLLNVVCLVIMTCVVWVIMNTLTAEKKLRHLKKRGN